MRTVRHIRLQYLQHAGRHAVRDLRSGVGASTVVRAVGSGVTPIDFSELGLAIGHATDDVGGTGLTVVRPIVGAMRCAAVTVGRATGTREFHAASPFHLVDRTDAVLLTGGSAYGLDAAAGVMRWMEERARGFSVGPGVVPIVPAAVIYDLAPCGHFTARPTPAMAYAACESATPLVAAEGSVGAGTGATVGKAAGAPNAMKGGVGVWVERSGSIAVGAVAVVNAFGDVRDGEGVIIAGARQGSAFLDSAATLASGAGRGGFAADLALQNTTITLVASSVTLSRVELQQLASAASAALYRRITPTGTSFDGDVVFAVCPAADPPADRRPVPVLQIEALAVRALEMAVERGVRSAVGRDGIPGLGDSGRARA